MFILPLNMKLLMIKRNISVDFRVFLNSRILLILMQKLQFSSPNKFAILVELRFKLVVVVLFMLIFLHESFERGCGPPV